MSVSEKFSDPGIRSKIWLKKEQCVLLNQIARHNEVTKLASQPILEENNHGTGTMTDMGGDEGSGDMNEDSLVECGNEDTDSIISRQSSIEDELSLNSAMAGISFETNPDNVDRVDSCSEVSSIKSNDDIEEETFNGINNEDLHTKKEKYSCKIIVSFFLFIAASNFVYLVIAPAEK